MPMPYAQKREFMICRRVCDEKCADAIPSAMSETIRKKNSEERKKWNWHKLMAVHRKANQLYDRKAARCSPYIAILPSASFVVVMNGRSLLQL